MEEKLKYIIEEVENLKNISKDLEWKYKLAVSNTLNQVESLIGSALAITVNISDLIKKIKKDEI